MSERPQHEIWLELTYGSNIKIASIVKAAPVLPTIVLRITKSRHRAFWSLRETEAFTHSDLKAAVHNLADLTQCPIVKISVRTTFPPRAGQLIATPHSNDYDGLMPVEEFIRKIKCAEAGGSAAHETLLPASDRGIENCFNRWLKRLTRRSSSRFVQSSIAYASYKAFALRHQEIPAGPMAFKRVMEASGYPWQHHRLHNRFFGLQFR